MLCYPVSKPDLVVHGISKKGLLYLPKLAPIKDKKKEKVVNYQDLTGEVD